MGDAFTPHDCSTQYLQTEVARIRHLTPEKRDARSARVLELYEEELQRRGHESRMSIQNLVHHV
jgi:hypothetical protein